MSPETLCETGISESLRIYTLGTARASRRARVLEPRATRARVKELFLIMSSRFAALPIWGVFLASLVPAMPGCTGPAAADEDVGASEHVGTSKEALVLPVGSTEINAVLGQGYDVAQQAFKGQCVRSDTTLPAGQPSARLSLDKSLSREELESDFGIEADAKARYGLWNGSASGKFQRSAQSDSYSIALVYSASYFLPSKGLDVNTLSLTPVGQSAQNGLTWAETCGDEAVTQIRLGGRFYIVYRIDFASKEVKDEFNAKVNVNAPFGSLRAQVESNKHLFQGKAKIHLEALQIGGDVTQLSRVVTGVNGAGTQNTLALVTCDLGDLAACERFVVNAVDYAANADVPTAFPSQLKSSPADVSYVTQPWITLGIQQPPAVLTQALKDARARLQASFEERSQLRNRVHRLLDNGFVTGAKESELRSWRDERFKAQFEQIFAAVKACYDDIQHANVSELVSACVEKVDALSSLPKPDNELLDAYGTEEQILKKWSSLGGVSSTLGAPVGAYETWPDNGLYREYQGGAIFWHPASGAFVVKGDILAAVKSQPSAGSPGHVGYPTGEEQPVGDGRGTFQTFTNGIVLRHPDFGTHAVPLAIAERYAALGGALGPWGYPVEDVRTGASGHVWQSFHRGGFPGAIHHRVGVGAFETIGAVHAKYKELADLRITLGAPLANEVVRNGGVVQTFEDGVIVVRNGAFVVSGSIYGKWLELGTEARFGWPVSAFKPRGSSGCQDFTSGVICQSAMLGRQVVAEVYGNVLARWTQLGRETGTVGFPITGESAFPSGRGRYNEFANGAVVQSPGVAGALHVEEKVFEEWRKSGFDRGCLGFPIEELRAQDVTLPGFRVRNVKAQRFQGGFMVVRDPVPGDRDHRERPEVHCR